MKSARNLRRGMSMFEFVGCLSALAGGVVLGSMYLGVDVKRLGVAVLQHAQLIDADEPKAAVTTSAETATTPAAPAPTNVESASTVASAPIAKPSTAAAETSIPPQPREEASETETPAPPAAAPVSPEAQPAAPAGALAELLSRESLIDLTDEQRHALTRAYWNALDNCTKEEVKHRHAGLPEDGNWQLFDYLTCRKKGHQQAVAFISKLNLRGVDGHVSAYAQKALAWHRDGVTLFSRALDLLTDAPSAQLSGPFAQSWQSAATQHQMEERLLRDKHNAVQAYLDHSLSAQPAAVETPPAPQ